MAESGFIHIFRALKHRNFRIFMTGQAVSQIGVWMQRVVVGWYTWELTHSATWLGIMSLADFIPAMFIGSLSGALADRVNRLTVIRVTQVASALTATALWAMVYFGWSSVALLFVLVLLASTAIAVNQPSRIAIVPNLVERENLHAAVAINSVVANAGRFVGPAVAGISIALWGVGPTFAIGAVFFSFPAFTLLLIKGPREETKPSGRSFLTEVVDGMVYTFRHPGIGPLMASMIVTSVLGKAIIAMFPAFSSEIFHRGAEGQAWLTGIVGGGAILGGVFMAQRGGIKGLTDIFILTIALIGAGLAAFAATDIFWVATLVTAMLGAALLINGTAAQTLIQNTVEGQMRGRVASVYIMTQRGGQSLGGFILGVLADIVGLRTSVALGGAVCLGFWLWSLHRKKSMTATLES